MELSLTHKFSAPTKLRSDISFNLKASKIYYKSMLYPNKATPSTPAIGVQIEYATGLGSTIAIPIEQVDKFCEEIKAFANEMAKITDDTLIK